MKGRKETEERKERERKRWREETVGRREKEKEREAVCIYSNWVTSPEHYISINTAALCCALDNTHTYTPTHLHTDTQADREEGKIGPPPESPLGLQ